MDKNSKLIISGKEIAELKKLRARKSHLHFMQYCWYYKTQPFLVGQHTRIICERIDRAFNDLRKGKSTFLMVLVCFRHGKSEITSRFTVPHFLAEFPEKEVFVCSHNAKLAYKFSRRSQMIMESDSFKELYPDIGFDPARKSVEEFVLSNGIGKAQYIGLGGGISGIGGDLIIVDDFFGSRADAESAAIRAGVNTAIVDDVLTRRPSPCIFLMTVTPWHVDDPVGTIRRRMKEEKDFPEFEVLEFPAFSDRYKTGTLYPEKYPLEWYEQQRAILSLDNGYSYNSLMQVNPVRRSGNFLKIDKIKYYDKITDVTAQPSLWVRGWDLASSLAQYKKNDPDYTVGVKLTINYIKSNISGVEIPVCYIEDVIRGRWEAPQRLKVERDTAIGDGQNCYVYCESIAGYKDNYTTLKNDLYGIASVYSHTEIKDLFAKIQDFAVSLEAGNVYIKKAEWNQVLIDELRNFPSGSHDDIVSAIATAWYGYKNSCNMSLFLEPSNNLASTEDIVFIKECIIKIENGVSITCQREIYITYLRNHIMEFILSCGSQKTKSFAEAEIKRLDLQFNYNV